MIDVPLSDAMLCWNTGGGAIVVHHPDERGAADSYRASVCAAYGYWEQMSDDERRHKLMIEAWHAVAFDQVPAADMAKALLVVPEYRAMLARDCLPSEYQHERED